MTGLFFHNNYEWIHGHWEVRLGWHNQKTALPPNPSSTWPNWHCSLTTIAVSWAQVLNCGLLRFSGPTLLLRRQQAGYTINEASTQQWTAGSSGSHHDSVESTGWIWAALFTPGAVVYQSWSQGRQWELVSENTSYLRCLPLGPLRRKEEEGRGGDRVGCKGCSCLAPWGNVSIGHAGTLA